MNQELKDKIDEGLRELMSDNLIHSIDGISNILHTVPQEYIDKEKLIESKVNSMKRLSEEYGLGLINDVKAKNELFRILHGSSNTGKVKE